MTSSDGVITVRTIVDLPEPERDQLDALTLATRSSRDFPVRLGGVVHPYSI